MRSLCELHPPTNQRLSRVPRPSPPRHAHTHTHTHTVYKHPTHSTHTPIPTAFTAAPTARAGAARDTTARAGDSTTLPVPVFSSLCRKSFICPAHTHIHNPFFCLCPPPAFCTAFSAQAPAFVSPTAITLSFQRTPLLRRHCVSAVLRLSPRACFLAPHLHAPHILSLSLTNHGAQAPPPPPSPSPCLCPFCPFACRCARLEALCRPPPSVSSYSRSQPRPTHFLRGSQDGQRISARAARPTHPPTHHAPSSLPSKTRPRPFLQRILPHHPPPLHFSAPHFFQAGRLGAPALSRPAPPSTLCCARTRGRHHHHHCPPGFTTCLPFFSTFWPHFAFRCCVHRRFAFYHAAALRQKKTYFCTRTHARSTPPLFFDTHRLQLSHVLLRTNWGLQTTVQRSSGECAHTVA